MVTCCERPTCHQIYRKHIWHVEPLSRTPPLACRSLARMHPSRCDPKIRGASYHYVFTLGSRYVGWSARTEKVGVRKREKAYVNVPNSVHKAVKGYHNHLNVEELILSCRLQNARPSYFPSVLKANCVVSDATR